MVRNLFRHQAPSFQAGQIGPMLQYYFMATQDMNNSISCIAIEQEVNTLVLLRLLFECAYLYHSVQYRTLER